jgi:hypothetical protein
MTTKMAVAEQMVLGKHFKHIIFLNIPSGKAENHRGQYHPIRVFVTRLTCIG